MARPWWLVTSSPPAGPAGRGCWCGRGRWQPLTARWRGTRPPRWRCSSTPATTAPPRSWPPSSPASWTDNSPPCPCSALSGCWRASAPTAPRDASPPPRPPGEPVTPSWTRSWTTCGVCTSSPGRTRAPGRLRSTGRWWCSTSPTSSWRGQAAPPPPGRSPATPPWATGRSTPRWAPRTSPWWRSWSRPPSRSPPEQRSRARLLVRAVLTDSPDLAQDLRHGQVVLEPRTQAQVSATSPRGPPWTPSHVAATIATGHDPWHPPPAQEQRHGQTRQDTRGQQPGQDQPGAPTGADPSRTTSLREASFPHPPTAAVRVPPPQTGQPSRPLTREEVLARITTQQPRTPRQTPTRKHRHNRGLGR